MPQKKNPPSPKSALKQKTWCRQSPRLKPKLKPPTPTPQNDIDIEAQLPTASEIQDVRMESFKQEQSAPPSKLAEAEDSADKETPAPQQEGSNNEAPNQDEAEEESVEAEFDNKPAEEEIDVATDSEVNNVSILGQVCFAGEMYKNAVMSNDNPVTEIQ